MNPDYRDLLSEFNAHRVEFLVIGAHAVAAHGHVRATKDFDVWVRPLEPNAQRVLDALGAFGAPLHGTTVEDLCTPDRVLQIGVAPVRIDIFTSIPGVEFDEAWAERVTTTFAGETATVLSKRHLIINKRATGRMQDLADVEVLTSGGDEAE